MHAIHVEKLCFLEPGGIRDAEEVRLWVSLCNPFLRFGDCFILISREIPEVMILNCSKFWLPRCDRDGDDAFDPEGVKHLFLTGGDVIVHGSFHYYASFMASVIACSLLSFFMSRRDSPMFLPPCERMISSTSCLQW